MTMSELSDEQRHELFPPWEKTCARCDHHSYHAKVPLFVFEKLDLMELELNRVAYCSLEDSPMYRKCIVGHWGCLYSTALDMDRLLYDKHLSPELLLPDGSKLSAYLDTGMPMGRTVGEILAKQEDKADE